MPATSAQPPPKKKTKEEAYSHDSWLVDDSVEVDVEDDHLPPPDPVCIEEDEDYETDDEMTAASISMRTSDINNVLS